MLTHHTSHPHFHSTDTRQTGHNHGSSAVHEEEEAQEVSGDALSFILLPTSPLPPTYSSCSTSFHSSLSILALLFILLSFLFLLFLLLFLRPFSYSSFFSSSSSSSFTSSSTSSSPSFFPPPPPPPRTVSPQCFPSHTGIQ